MNRLPESEKNKINRAKAVHYGYYSSFYKLDTYGVLMNMLIDIERLREMGECRLYDIFTEFIRSIKKEYPRNEFKKGERDKLFYELIMRNFHPLELTDDEKNCLSVVEYCEKNNINVNIIRGIFDRSRRKISMDVFTI